MDRQNFAPCLHVETLTLNVTVLEDEAYKEIIYLN